MDHLDYLENQSIYILREAYKKFKDLAMLWSIGKDSTTLVWLAKKAFYGRIPFPLVHIDTSYKFPEMIDFREKYAKEWGVNLIVGQNKKALDEGMDYKMGRFECCNALKTDGLKDVIAEHKFKGLILGIRRDEEGSRAKERYFSPRDENFQWDYKDQPPELWDQFQTEVDDKTHIRIHPILQWTEVDVWEYVKREKIPTVGLYFAKNGKRYRTLGCMPCCVPVKSKAKTIDQVIKELKTTTVTERSGRLQDQEGAYKMQKLRTIGYM